MTGFKSLWIIFIGFVSLFIIIMKLYYKSFKSLQVTMSFFFSLL